MNQNEELRLKTFLNQKKIQIKIPPKMMAFFHNYYYEEQLASGQTKLEKIPKLIFDDSKVRSLKTSKNEVLA
jgi:alpha-glucuronidase